MPLLIGSAMARITEPTLCVCFPHRRENWLRWASTNDPTATAVRPAASLQERRFIPSLAGRVGPFQWPPINRSFASALVCAMFMREIALSPIPARATIRAMNAQDEMRGPLTVEGDWGERAAPLDTDAIPAVQAELELIAARITVLAWDLDEAHALLPAAVLVHEAAKRVMRPRPSASSHPGTP